MKVLQFGNIKKYLHIDIINCPKKFTFYVNNFVFQVNDEGKSEINNIITKENNVKIEYDNEEFPDIKINITTSSSRKYSQQQIKYNIDNNIQMLDSIFYNHIKRGEKLIITFNGFLDSNIRYCISTLKSMPLKDFSILAFQDNYNYGGSYYTATNEGNSLFSRIVNFIKNLIDENNYKEEDIIFFGASKGGTAALIYHKYFPRAICYAVVPQIDYIKFCEVRYHYTINTLIETGLREEINDILDNPKVRICFSKRDSIEHKVDKFGSNVYSAPTLTHTPAAYSFFPIFVSQILKREFKYNELEYFIASGIINILVPKDSTLLVSYVDREENICNEVYAPIDGVVQLTKEWFNGVKKLKMRQYTYEESWKVKLKLLKER